ncbi:MAG TPA: ABC transporter substrate-binding protein [Polyangia bacterium]|jgi:branched-chain amino acid transport system substrate-binding protein
MRALVFCASVMLCGCSAVLSFHECNVDKDCSGTTPAGTPLYCSDDHMCVGAIPDARLCQQSVPPPPMAIPDGALIVGGLYRTSGANDVNDHTFRNAADLAASELGAMYPIAHIVCDTAGDPDQAARAYDVVIDRFGAQVIVGPDTSDEVFAVAKEVESRGVPLISPSATNPNISGLDDDSLVWRTAASDNLQAIVLATLPAAGAKLDIIFVSDSAYATGLEDAFLSNYPGSVANTLGFPSGDTATMNSVVATASNDAPTDALLIADFDAPPLMAAVAKASGLATTQFLMTDSAKKPSLWGQLGGVYTVMSRVRGTGPANPSFDDPSGMAFAVMQTNYKAKFGGEDPAETAFVGNAYDAFYAAAFAGLSLPAGKRAGKNIVANLGRMSDGSGTSVVVGPNSISAGVTTLQNGGTINLTGTSGPIDFDANGDVKSAPIEKWSVDISGAMPMFRTDAIVVP